MQYIVENLYKEVGKSTKKEDNLSDDFRRRLAKKKKITSFHREMANFEEIK
jgi:hypothetical protein